MRKAMTRQVGMCAHRGLFISPTLGDGHCTHFADGKTEAPGRELAFLTSPRCYEAGAGFECKPVELHLPR